MSENQDGDQPTPPPGWGPPSPPPLAQPTPLPPPHWSQQQPPPVGPPVGPGWGQGGWGAPPPPEVKPGIVALRPLGVGEILDGAITCMRVHWRVMIGFSAAVVGITTSLQLVAQLILIKPLENNSIDSSTSGADFASFIGANLGVALIAALLGFVAQVLLTGILTMVVSQAVLGRSIAVRDAWAHVRPRIWALIGLSIVYGLAVAGGLVACLVGALWPYTVFALASPALILEQQRVFGSMGRSFRLVQGAFWRTFGVLVLAFIVKAIVGGVIGLPFTLAGGGTGQVFGDPTNLSTLNLVLQAIGRIVSGTITTPFAAAVIVLVYVDRRIRREALDIELARAAGLTVPGQSATPGAVPPTTGW